MSRLFVLIRHARPEIVRGVPPSRWRLSAAGEVEARELVETLLPCLPAAVFASAEPKAVATVEPVAAFQGREVQVVPGLGELDRDGEPFSDQATFEAGVAATFARPDEVVYGSESATAALARFAAAVELILERNPAGNLVIASHGTVMSLFVAAKTGRDPRELWRTLDFATPWVLQLPDWQLLSVD